ncbi:quinolinate synthase NadA [Desulfobotulus sp. H1]|uniref:Quinolinate synthase n=1 Tax=Desulfobotulus pelophilus TaxID=2823377 RepID=A0ABT3NDC3_9BACT|nr:quinolinate synthase NadA [Desulfobotulus pelophilus]MCW7754937.1 quinolinate synthase NadA [Desulfobotulus pelophilus]
MKDIIRQLARKKNAIILAHNYVPSDIQDVADLCGDSLELSLKAAETDADIIVFCGVRFMAETAAILSPEKTVLLPVEDAGCPMADMVTPETLRQRKAQLPGIPVVTYVNSTAAVKALSDICCTSANVLQVVESLDSKEILMTPDRNLALYAASHTSKTIHLWEGFCPFHNTLTRQDVMEARKQHPEALFIAHPECPPEVLLMADAISSTSGMIRMARESDHREFIIGTETGLLHPLQQACPEKAFYPASTNMFCPDMKKISLAILASTLEKESGRVQVSEDIRLPALKAVKRMMALKG